MKTKDYQLFRSYDGTRTLESKETSFGNVIIDNLHSLPATDFMIVISTTKLIRFSCSDDKLPCSILCMSQVRGFNMQFQTHFIKICKAAKENSLVCSLKISKTGSVPVEIPFYTYS